jgi:sec-independent protein translocase protein TatA
MILFLSDVAGSEVVLILLFILMFFGSKSIPGIAKTMGRTMRQIKDASQDLQNEIKKSGVDIKNDLNLNRMIEETVEDFERPFQEQTREMNASIAFEPPRKFEAPIHPETLDVKPLDQDSNDQPTVSEPIQKPIETLKSEELPIQKEEQKN